MKCAYGAAILDAFLDDGITFDYVNGASAGSANAASYLAGQKGRNLRFYTDHIHEPGYFGLKSFLKTGDLFGLEYIYSDLTNSYGGDFLDYPKVQANPAEYEVVATNAITGEPAYFDGKAMEQDNYQEIKASCALPAACKPRIVNGIPYYDGGMSDPIPVDRALSKGCDRVVTILSKPADYSKSPEKMKLFYSIACRKYPKIVEMLNNRHITYMEHFRHVFDLQKEGKNFVFAPSKNLAMNTFAMDADANYKLYELGLEDYKNNRDAFLRFMDKSRISG